MEYNPYIKIENDPDVYPPSDDSILLIKSLNIRPKERILEIGCGSGIVSIHCSLNGCYVICGDINPKAVELTKRNAILNNTEIDVRETDIYSNIHERFNTIIFNPPYLPVNEGGLLAKSWSGGMYGIKQFSELIDRAPRYLLSNGRVISVVSSMMDKEKLHNILRPYDVETIGNLNMFFERLAVISIKIC